MRISVVLPILTPTPFLRAMTEFCIKTLRMHADEEFELIVVEAEGDIKADGAGYFDPDYYTDDFGLPTSKFNKNCGEELCCIDKYLNFNPKIGGIKEVNLGIRAASGEFIVTAGNDVIVPPHWDTELLRCFEERKDCGIAALSAFEPGSIVGPPEPQDRIVEGMYTPFNMFRKGWEYDESYRKIYQDPDMIFRMYEAGLRCFRSCRAHVHHLCRMTTSLKSEAEQHDLDLAHDERLFYKRWGKSPLAIFALTRCGQYHYGQEHQSWTTNIQLHYDPNKEEG